MKKNKIIDSLNVELNALPIPDVLESVRRKSSIIPLQNTVSVQQKKLASKPFFLRLTAAMVVIAMLAIFIFQALPLNPSQTLTVITLDINPSLELAINETEEIVAVNAVNADAETLLQNLTLVGQNLETGIDILLEKAKQSGYLDENTTENAIMVSVKNQNAEKQIATQTRLQTALNQYLNNQNITCTVISEDYTAELLEEYEQEGVGLNITPAKYSYMKKVLTRFPALTSYKHYLAQMNVEELYQLLNEDAEGTIVLQLIARIMNHPNDQGNIGGNGNN